MKARHKDTGEIIELAEEGIISHDGRRFCWYQVELIPEPIDEWQSEVDLEKEIDVFFYGKNFKRCNDGVSVPGALMRDWQNQHISMSLNADEIRRFARHFHEL